MLLLAHKILLLLFAVVHRRMREKLKLLIGCLNILPLILPISNSQINLTNLFIYRILRMKGFVQIETSFKSPMNPSIIRISKHLATWTQQMLLPALVSGCFVLN